MIAIPVPAQRWLFVLSILSILVVATTAWRARPVTDEPPAGARPEPRPATYRHVPLLGEPLWDTVHEARGYADYWDYRDDDDQPIEPPAGPVKTCLPFLAPILEYPSWQLRISRGVSGCFGDVVQQDFTIASTGEVTWTKPGWPVRRVGLSSEQLALVRRLDRLSCVDLKPSKDKYEDGWVQIGLDLGKHQESGGARISPASVLGRAVTAMLDEIEEQYRRPRREPIGAMDLRLETSGPGPVYRARVTGGRLTVKRGSKVWVDEPLDPDQQLDLFDAILERRAVDTPDSSLTGVLLLNGASVPVRASMYEGRSPFVPIVYAISSAQVHDERARAGQQRPW